MPACKSSAFISIPILLTLATFLQFGCQSQTDKYVTREEFDRFLKGMPFEVIADDSPRSKSIEVNRQQRIDSCIQEIAAARTIGQRAAALLVASDEATVELRKTFQAIDEATRIVAENLANEETTAYKARRFKRDAGQFTYTFDFSQGPFENTGRVLDLAIQGDGFFVVQNASTASVMYTRNGNLFRRSDGTIVFGFGNGHVLSPAISIPSDAAEITINRQGLVEYAKAGVTGKNCAGQIQLACFVIPDQLKSLDGRLFVETEESGKPILNHPGDKTAGTVLQNFLEASNVDVDREMVRLSFLIRWRDAMLQAVHSPATNEQAHRPDVSHAQKENIAGAD